MREVWNFFDKKSEALDVLLTCSLESRSCCGLVKDFLTPDALDKWYSFGQGGKVLDRVLQRLSEDGDAGTYQGHRADIAESLLQTETLEALFRFGQGTRVVKELVYFITHNL